MRRYTGVCTSFVLCSFPLFIVYALVRIVSCIYRDRFFVHFATEYRGQGVICSIVYLSDCELTTPSQCSSTQRFSMLFRSCPLEDDAIPTDSGALYRQPYQIKIFRITGRQPSPHKVIEVGRLSAMLSARCAK